MKILAITQARYGSTRLPAKILKTVGDRTLLEIHLRRILKAGKISKLKIATTSEEGASHIIAVADKVGVEYFQGSVDDVLARFYDTAAPEAPDYVVRLTSDCPLIDPAVIDTVISAAVEGDFDYVRTDPASYPDGLDTEVFRFPALERAYREAAMTSEREHVTPYIWKNGTAEGGTLFRSLKVANPEGEFPADKYRITLDEPEDFEVLRSLIDALGIDRPWKEYIDYLSSHAEIRSINSRFGYNEGYIKSLNNDKKTE
ncbi:MAG: glycosyltransferase family protein [Bacteroidales bacterium]|nr:glycosyltransferase family protein [Candidatus Hennigimonas equi]